jgi:hypothetical protein
VALAVSFEGGEGDGLGVGAGDFYDDVAGVLGDEAGASGEGAGDVVGEGADLGEADAVVGDEVEARPARGEDATGDAAAGEVVVMESGFDLVGLEFEQLAICGFHFFGLYWVWPGGRWRSPGRWEAAGGCSRPLGV